MSQTIALLGAFDTKGSEYAFVKERIEEAGFQTLTIDVGVLAEPAFQPDIASSEIAKAGGVNLASLRAEGDRGKAVSAMSEGAAITVARLYAEDRFHGILSMGGTGGTSVACKAMRALPLGGPKVMVSTAAGTDVSAYVGVKDIVMIPSIVDVAGINPISREVFSRAAGAICGMVSAKIPKGADRPLIAASMFGNTTTCIDHARGILENAGYDVLVFHCTGTGGRTMESLIESKWVVGVLDLTTTEWADEIVGGVFAAGPDRLRAAAQNGIPAVIGPGCLDMVNFGAPDTIPEKFNGRVFYEHNPNVTLMRTTPEECRRIGEAMTQRINESVGPVSVLLPKQGVSMIDLEGAPFHSPEAQEVLLDTIRNGLRDDISCVTMDCEMNAVEYAEHAANTLLAQLNSVGVQ
jgi:uncharacterized protein (UPF0261 family)